MWIFKILKSTSQIIIVHILTPSSLPNWFFTYGISSTRQVISHILLHFSWNLSPTYRSWVLSYLRLLHVQINKLLSSRSTHTSNQPFNSFNISPQQRVTASDMRILRRFGKLEWQSGGGVIFKVNNFRHVPQGLYTSDLLLHFSFILCSCCGNRLLMGTAGPSCFLQRISKEKLLASVIELLSRSNWLPYLFS